MLSIEPRSIKGFPLNECERFQKLLDTFNEHDAKNQLKARYYEGKIPLSEVNLGIALPTNMDKLEIGCSWGAKTVDVLASRSMFDGFVGLDGKELPLLDRIVENNNFIAEYTKACRDELKLGCTFATLSADKDGCKIKFHSPQTACALWNGEKGQIDCGFAIIDWEKETEDSVNWRPTLIYYYTEYAIIVLRYSNEFWTATILNHKMQRPLMEAMVWNATSDKPFGRSRIKEPIRRLIQGYVRTIANATIGLEFATSPQKYLLGITDEQFETVVNQKFKQYVGSIITATPNPETGSNPSFGQLAQGNIQPHVEMIRILATQFSSATGLSVTDTGVVNDANPTSSDAILAQTQTLVGMAEQLNQSNGNALKNIALMSIAIAENKTLDELTDEQKSIVARFKNPAMPNISISADSAIKIASARPEFSKTDVFLEMIGFSKADIRRIKAQEQLAQTNDAINSSLLG